MKGKETRGRGGRVYPDLVFNGVVLGYLLLGVLITLAIMRPFGLGQPADPLVAPEVVKPEWYFLPFYQFINYLPKKIGTGIVFLGLFLFCVWPFVALAGKGGRLERARRRTLLVVAILFTFFYFSLMLVGYLAETERTILGKTYRFDAYGIPHRGPAMEKEESPSEPDAGRDSGRQAERGQEKGAGK